HAARHIALGDAVAERDHREGTWTLHVDGIDRRGSHEWRPSGRILRGHGATSPGVAVREVVDVARGHRAVDVEGNVQLVPGRNGERDRVAGDAPLRIGREGGRAAEGERDGRGGEVSLGTGQRDGGGVQSQRPVACPEADPQARACPADGNPGAIHGPRGSAHRRIERLVEAWLEYEALRSYGHGEGDAGYDGCGKYAEESIRPSILHSLPPEGM